MGSEMCIRDRVLFQYNEGRKIIKIGNDLDLDGEIVLQKYNDSWGEWVDVSCLEICHMDKIKVARLAEPHNHRGGSRNF